MREMARYETGRAEQMDRLAQSAVLQGLGAQQQGYGQALTGRSRPRHGRGAAQQS